MGRDEDPKSLGDLGKKQGEAAVEGLVAAIRMIHEAKQAVRSAGSDGGADNAGGATATLPVGELLFDLAKLHTRMVGDLARFGTEQADMMVRFLRKRQGGGESAPRRPPILALVSATMEHGASARAAFRLRNDAEVARTYALPAVIELHPLAAGGDDRLSVFVEIEAQPARVTVEPLGEAQVGLTFPWSARLAAGRHRARVPLEPEDEAHPSVELIVELDVKDQQKPGREAGATKPKRARQGRHGHER